MVISWRSNGALIVRLCNPDKEATPVRILIVEDDSKWAEFVARGLRAERFAVDLVSNGREGQNYIHSFSYDLLILALMLPQLSGTELLRRVRQSMPRFQC